MSRKSSIFKKYKRKIIGGFFRWSADERYFGFLRSSIISIYETTSFQLVDKKPIELNGLITFEWNPAKNMIAYYCEEKVNLCFLYDVY